MKLLMIVVLVGLFLSGGSMVLWASFGDKTANNNVYGPRGGIYSQTGEELFPAWPSTL